MTTESVELRPPRGYSWPPFTVGHELSTTHGADSERRVSPLALALEAEILTAAPWCRPAVFASTVRALARVEAQAELVHRWLDAHGGPLDDDGVPRPALAALDRFEGRAQRLRGELGLSPSTWVALMRQVVADPSDEAGDGGVAALKVIGKQIIEATAQASATPTTTNDGADHLLEELAGQVDGEGDDDVHADTPETWNEVGR